MPSNPFRKNFVRIAEFVTKFYLELQSNYGYWFKDEASMLATAGAMTTLDYILPPKATMSVSEIIAMANDAVHNGKVADPLIPFVFDLETGMQVAAGSYLDRQKIYLFLIMKGKSIIKAVEKTRKTYKSDKSIADAIVRFIQEAECKEVRDKLEIINDAIRCPKHNLPMVLRIPKKRGHKFYGCPLWPDCKYTVDYEKERSLDRSSR